ncbi:MAG TPA: pyruvate, phosphate dikinase, partial [candidate division Zixibacteria bacterium]|nr:pyruvate, phosphate dikinase [candidate division Zixibacteria bacterium]
AMVFGNMGDNCATGVAFTRNPATGENKFYGEYLMNAQGEDVVAGIRTPNPISELKDAMPQQYAELIEIREKLEKRYRDMQDVEFTIESGKLWMLQTRTGKRTIFAALRIAVEMVEEGLINKEEAIMRVSADQLNQLFAPILDPNDQKHARDNDDVVGHGLPASPGGATGRIIFNADRAEEVVERVRAEAEKMTKHQRIRFFEDQGTVILTRIETTPEDIGGMAIAKGILTSRGGMTSHAAVVARGMGVPCVAGAGELVIDYKNKTLKVAGKTFKEGDFVSIDGFTGEVYGRPIEIKPSEILQVLNGALKPEDSLLYRQYEEFMGWADEIRRLGIRTNADTPKDTAVAVKFGAQGIGLTRTEHMFFEGDRIVAFREMIMADDLEGREKALAKILPMQREDFEGIFRALEGRPATIRALDPPLHEFLPHDEEGQKQVANEIGVSPEDVKAKVESLHESNPMLGHRGCRLGIIYPEITAMQARAIMEASVNVLKEGIEVHPEIMIPLVGEVKELELQKDVVVNVAEEVLASAGLSKKDIPYLVGTMIEIPRAVVTADEIAEVAEFFSFGTNDLTQMGCGFSRDDAGKFLPDYVKMGIYEKDPFQSLDQRGVGKLVAMGVELGRKARPDLKIGICGEHGGDPDSIDFCHRVGLDYVSCSPYRVPVARLSAAQAVLRNS